MGAHLGPFGIDFGLALVDVAPVYAAGVDVALCDGCAFLVSFFREDGVADGFLEAGTPDGNGGADGLFSGFVDVFGEVELDLHLRSGLCVVCFVWSSEKVG